MKKRLSNFEATALPRNLFPRLGLVLLLFALFAGCDAAPGRPAASVTTAGTAQLEIDFSGKSENFVVDIPCSANSTVLEIMKRAQNIGDLDFESTGSGETAFVSAVDDVKNEGASGNNWVFRVNGKLGDRSCGVYPVKKGDHILWVFGEYQ